ncbi:hypothetical protein F8M41_002225 [Gigaspora margarita]|uniref:Secreted protein n=1 Tax=Gigaspora margarita TaxID=4874 RepID=A0A8H4AYQ8_GIGMA|nr:hypothetical protein F8M41_002225 [Gigaspora margarita]
MVFLLVLQRFLVSCLAFAGELFCGISSGPLLNFSLAFDNELSCGISSGPSAFFGELYCIIPSSAFC